MRGNAFGERDLVRHRPQGMWQRAVRVLALKRAYVDVNHTQDTRSTHRDQWVMGPHQTTERICATGGETM